MPEIFFPSRNLTLEELFGQDGPAMPDLARNNAYSCNALTANMPYCLAESKAHPESRIITQTLGNLSPASRQNLMCTIDTFGGDFTSTLAAFYDQNLAFFNLQNSAGLVGAGATASEARFTGLQKALVNYAKTLDALEAQKGVGRGPSATKAELSRRARQAYGVLESKYQVELKKLASPNSLGKNRGNALSSAERGITLAQRKRGRGINVANNAKAQQLARLATSVSYAGKGLIALDAGIRLKGVHHTYKQGGNWQREAAMQATGFGFGGAAGVFTGARVIAGLTTIGLGLTPVGWVVMIGVGMAVGFGAAYMIDRIAQDGAGRIYDRR